MNNGLPLSIWQRVFLLYGNNFDIYHGRILFYFFNLVLESGFAFVTESGVLILCTLQFKKYQQTFKKKNNLSNNWH